MKRHTTLILFMVLLMLALAACGEENAPLSTGEQGGQVPAPDTLEGDDDTDDDTADDVEPGDAETIGDATGGQGNTTTGGEVVGSETGDDDDAGDDEATSDIPAFITTWQDEGAVVEMGGEVPVSLFEGAEGQTYIVDGEELQVYHFEDEDAAEEAAATISPDGGMINDVSVRWAGMPNFYREGDTIVLYVGDDAATIERLNGAFGEPFAGGK